MSDFFQWLAGGSASSIIFIAVLSVLVVGFVLIYTVAFIQGREISFWPLKIGAQPESKTPTASTTSGQNTKNKDAKTHRISLMCSTTHEIEISPEKQEALRLFYKSLLIELERTPICLNTCGSEPLRGIILENYASKLRTHSKSQLESINSKVRWYWYMGDTSGFGFEPPVYDSKQTINIVERPIKEALDSDIVISFTGRTGTREQIARLLQYHQQKQYGLDFNRNPLILLGWFGGSVKEFINDNLGELDWLIQKYPELEPTKEIKDWYQGDKPKELAHRLIGTVQRLLADKMG